MNPETLRNFCLSLDAVTEDIKWQNDLCFLVAGKIFCITGLDYPFMFSLKVKDDEFESLSATEGIVPAPYLARCKWILVKDPDVFSKKQWEHFIRQSYEIVKSKIPRKVLVLHFKTQADSKKRKAKSKRKKK